jgi:ArsR family transcriptional regulator
MRLNVFAHHLKNVGEENRLRILCAIFKHGAPCVSDIAHKTGLGVAVVSHHLRVLAREGVLEAKSEGKRVCYTPAHTSFVSGLRDFLCAQVGGVLKD